MATAFDEIKLAENEKIKVWDVLLTPEGIKKPYQLQPFIYEGKMDVDKINEDRIERSLWPFIGRVRILAVMNKKPDKLENIRFSVAFCAPSDLFKYTKERANNICVGRWNNAFGEPKHVVDMNNNLKEIPAHLLDYKCTGVIPSLDTLSGFVEKALIHVNGYLPQWVHGCAFSEEKLVNRLFQEFCG